MKRGPIWHLRKSARRGIIGRLSPQWRRGSEARFWGRHFSVCGLWVAGAGSLAALAGQRAEINTNPSGRRLHPDVRTSGMAKRSFYARWSVWILLAHAILVPLACIAAIRAVKSNKNDVADWLPADYPETKELGWFRQHFIADQFVLISWDGCTLGDDPDGKDDDPRIEKLVAAIKGAPPAARGRLGRRSGVQSRGHHHRPHGAQRADARADELGSQGGDQRLTGSLIGPDGKQTVVMANLTERRQETAQVDRPADEAVRFVSAAHRRRYLLR